MGRNTTEILYSTSEDSDDSEYTTTLLRNQWLDQHNKSIKTLYNIRMNSYCKKQSNEMLPFAAVSSSSTPPSPPSSSTSETVQYNITPKRNNKRQYNDQILPYSMLDSRITSSSSSPPATAMMMMMMPTSTSSSPQIIGGKRRKKNQTSTNEYEESQEYLNNILKTYCCDGKLTISTTTNSIIRYANLNDMLLRNEGLYTALMLQLGNVVIETACLHCRNFTNLDLLEWSEAVLIQFCAINYNNVLANTWSNVISFVESSEWGPKLSLNLQRIYGRMVRLSNILNMNHNMKMQKYNMPAQFVFLENRIPALNMQLLRTIPRCDRDDLEEMNLRQSLARLPIVIRKKKNIITNK